MTASKKLSLIFLFSLSALLLAATFVFARELEVVLPGDNAPKTTSALLPDYLKYIFNFALGISGMIVFGVIVFAGVKVVLYAHNPAGLSEAKKQIYDGILGLLILFGTYIFLTTINPQLVNINPEIKGVNMGVILYSKDPTVKDFNVSRDQKTVTASLADLGDFNKYYKFNTPPSYLNAYTYTATNFSDGEAMLGGSGCQSKACPFTNPNSPPKSIKLDYQYPGVYLCKPGPGVPICQVYTASNPQLSKDFEDKVNQVDFKNPYTYDPSIKQEDCTVAKLGEGANWWTEDSTGKPLLDKSVCGYYSDRYMAVLHEARNYGYTCDVYAKPGTIPQKAYPDRKDILVGSGKGADNYFPGDGVSSISVFLQRKPDSTETGKGVTLFEKPEYVTQDAGGKNIFKLYKEGEYEDLTAEGSKFKYDDGNQVGGKGKTLSVKVDDGYLALLFRGTGFQKDCLVLTGSHPNLGTSSLKEEIKSLKVIPIKK